MFLFKHRIYKCMLQDRLQFLYKMYEAILCKRHIELNWPFLINAGLHTKIMIIEMQIWYNGF